MKYIFIILFLSIFNLAGQDSLRTIHVFVALCDNVHQGIVPVPAKLGNGEDPDNNLYWGALYGIKSFFVRSNNWEFISTLNNPKPEIKERCVFKHNSQNIYLIADAYRGKEIKKTVIDFLLAASGNSEDSVAVIVDSQNTSLKIGGKSNLISYIGHDGLMDFELDNYPVSSNDNKREVIILACISREYFEEPIRNAGAKPLLWTTGLMAPEAYTLEAAIAGWILNETYEQIRSRAATAYSRYQKCSLRAAKNLLVTGW